MSLARAALPSFCCLLLACSHEQPAEPLGDAEVDTAVEETRVDDAGDDTTAIEPPFDTGAEEASADTSPIDSGAPDVAKPETDPMCPPPVWTGEIGPSSHSTFTVKDGSLDVHVGNAVSGAALGCTSCTNRTAIWQWVKGDFDVTWVVRPIGASGYYVALDFFASETVTTSSSSHAGASIQFEQIAGGWGVDGRDLGLGKNKDLLGLPSSTGIYELRFVRTGNNLQVYVRGDEWKPPMSFSVYQDRLAIGVGAWNGIGASGWLDAHVDDFKVAGGAAVPDEFTCSHVNYE